MQNEIVKPFLRHRMIVSMWDLEHLPEAYISGDMFEYPSGVYRSRYFDFPTARYYAYRLTSEGEVLHVYDSLCRWWKRSQWRMIRLLAMLRLGNPTPECCEPTWDDVWARWR